MASPGSASGEEVLPGGDGLGGEPSAVASSSSARSGELTPGRSAAGRRPREWHDAMQREIVGRLPRRGPRPQFSWLDWSFPTALGRRPVRPFRGSRTLGRSTGLFLRRTDGGAPGRSRGRARPCVVARRQAGSCDPYRRRRAGRLASSRRGPASAAALAAPRSSPPGLVPPGASGLFSPASSRWQARGFYTFDLRPRSSLLSAPRESPPTSAGRVAGRCGAFANGPDGKLTLARTPSARAGPRRAGIDLFRRRPDRLDGRREAVFGRSDSAVPAKSNGSTSRTGERQPWLEPSARPGWRPGNRPRPSERGRPVLRLLLPS